MFSLDELMVLLESMTHGTVAEAKSHLDSIADLDADLRREADSIMDLPAVERAQRLGDLIRAFGGDRALVNECYRASFWAGDTWQDLATNPLFAYFTANRSGAPLDKWIHYFPIYTRHLEDYRGRPTRLLEIGVYRGGGLTMLQRYLGPDAVLVGLDVDESARRAVGDRFVIELGDQQDPEVLRRVAELHGPFDVVIDDGGHGVDQQITSAETLFPLLSEGGTYLVEDCHTSYWADSEYAAADLATGTFMDWVRARIDDLHAHHFSRDRDLTFPWATHLSGVHVYDSLVVLEKARRFAPFCEVAGSGSRPQLSRRSATDGLAAYAATQGQEFDGTAARLVAARDEALSRAASLQDQAAETRQNLAETQHHLDETQEVLDQMLRSRSWRAMAPLRNWSRWRRKL